MTDHVPPPRRGRGRPKGPEKVKEPPRPIGKARLELNKETIIRLARIGCTTEEIALVLGCCMATIKNNYMDCLEKGRAQRRMSLRHRQYQKALTGDTGMMIWLGKQDLGQKERNELTGANDGPVQIQIVERFSVEVPKA